MTILQSTSSTELKQLASKWPRQQLQRSQTDLLQQQQQQKQLSQADLQSLANKIKRTQFTIQQISTIGSQHSKLELPGLEEKLLKMVQNYQNLEIKPLTAQDQQQHQQEHSKTTNVQKPFIHKWSQGTLRTNLPQQEQQQHQQPHADNNQQQQQQQKQPEFAQKTSVSKWFNYKKSRPNLTQQEQRQQQQPHADNNQQQQRSKELASKWPLQHQSPQIPEPIPATLSSLRSSNNKHPNSNIHWDNACSFHVTNNPDILLQMRPIKPDFFHGIGGSNSATHVGYLPCLPNINNINVCYFAPDFPQTLLSLGQIQACGGAYFSHNNPNVVKIYAVASDRNTLIDTAPLTIGSNLLPTTAARLSKTMSENAQLSTPSTKFPQHFFPHSIRDYICHNPLQQTISKSAFLGYNLRSLKFKPSSGPVSAIPEQDPTSAPPSNSPSTITPSSSVPKLLKLKWPRFSENPINEQFCQMTRRPSAAQLRLAAEALDLHDALGHPPDKKLCSDLSTGKHPHSILTPASVMLMRQIVGPCPHCLEGRAYRPAASQPASSSPPTERLGQVVSFDPRNCPTPS